VVLRKRNRGTVREIQKESSRRRGTEGEERLESNMDRGKVRENKARVTER